MYTRTPSRRPTTRRCFVYLGKSVRSSRVLGLTDIVGDILEEETRNIRRELRVTELRLFILFNLLDSLTKSHYQSHCDRR